MSSPPSPSSAQPTPFDYEFKFIVIGPSGVGKSCLLLQFTDKKFQSSHHVTIFVEFGMRSVTIDGKRVKIQIWDTAGQESYQSLTHSYYRGVHGALIVYDISQRDTFDHIGTWLEEVKYHSDMNTVVALVGNKSDLDERTVSEAEGREFAEEHGLLFAEVSAKTADNVDSIFVDVAKEIYERMQRGEMSNSRNSGTGIETVRQITKNNAQKTDSKCCS